MGEPLTVAAMSASAARAVEKSFM
ncbi:hypothetical protein PF006_g29731, partial [Phytophthora fragariae]